MSMALNVEPRCPEPARLTAHERVQPAGVREERKAHVGVCDRRAQAIELVLRDEAQRDHQAARTLVTHASRARITLPAEVRGEHLFVQRHAHPSPAGTRSSPADISGSAVTSSSRHGTSSTSNSRIRAFGIAAHHCAAMNVARWL